MLEICFWSKVREERIWAEYMGEKGGALNRLAELEIPPSRTQFSHKNLSPYYIGRARSVPPDGWGALDGGEGA